MSDFLNIFGLEGKVILVTGASSGIGRQIALSCAAAGATLIITGRDTGRLQAVLDELDSSRHSQVVADLENDDQVAALAANVGKIDGLINCAGIAQLAPLRMISRQHIESQLATNVVAPILLTRHLLARQAIRESGSILFISSIAAHVGVRGVAAYSATKAAVESAARCLSVEVCNRKIRVNCLAPGFVQTPMLAAALTTVGSLDTTVEKYPLGIGTPEDVANAAIFFLSDASRWITGTTLILDGGHTVG